MARIETWFNQDLQEAVKVRYIDGNVFSQDNNGNVVGVNVFDGGVPATLGGTVSANIIRADGATVAAEGVLSGNQCSVVLPQSAYSVPGVLSIIIKLTSGDDITTVCAVVGNVYMSTTDTVIDPGTVIPSIETLIAEIEAAIASIPADYSSLWTALAPTFSSSTSYTAGQYVTYNGGLYRFTNNHSGSWSSSDVQAVNVGQELTGKASMTELAPAFSTTASYKPGDYVRYNNQLYVCNVPHSGAWSSSDFSVLPLSEGIKEIYEADAERTKLVASYSQDNLLANVSWTEGKYISSDGSLVEADFMMYSDLVPITHPYLYVVSYIPRGRRVVTRVHGYDENGNWLSQLGAIASENTEIGKCSRIFVRAENCTYIRISTCRYYDTVYFGKALDNKIDESYYNARTEILATTEEQNLLDGITFLDHKITNSGVLVTSNGMKCSEMFRVAPHTDYVLSYYVPTESVSLNNIFVVGYDLNGNYIKLLLSVPPAGQTQNKLTMVRFLTDNAAYIRIETGISYSLALCKAGNELANVISETLYDPFTVNYWENGSISYNDGAASITSATRIRTTDYIDLSTRYIVAHKKMKFMVYVYDRAGTYLGVWNNGATVKGESYWVKFADIQKIYSELASTAPDCLCKLVAAYDGDSELTTAARQNIVFYTAVKNKLCATVGLYETWAVCGASYDAGSYSGHSNTYKYSWPTVLARRSGNTLTNYSQGGATTKTFAEGTGPHTLRQALLDEAKELYVLTFGGNDANHPDTIPVGSLSDITSHSSWEDYPATFYGNYGKILERLMDHAPNAKFVMTTPSSNWYNSAQTTIDGAIREIADHYDIPLIVWESDDFIRSDLYNKTMVGSHPVPITYSGMALAFERLFSRCVFEYADYFTAIS